MHSDSKKRRSFLAMLFAAGDVWRWAVLQAYRLGQHSLVQGADDFGYPVG
jgi:succinate dehydrogenase/fumarate reductase flavoprotein subunit